MTNSKLNPASEAISMVKAAQTNEEDIPVTPLPDPGEGGPVYDGSMNNDPMDNGSEFCSCYPPAKSRRGRTCIQWS